MAGNVSQADEIIRLQKKVIRVMIGLNLMNLAHVFSHIQTFSLSHCNFLVFST